MPSVSPEAAGKRGVKGSSAEELNGFPFFNIWAVGEYPPDCRASGELSVIVVSFYCHGQATLFMTFLF